MSETKQQLRAHGTYARKDLGQHWLVDADAVEAIVEAAAVAPDDEIIEVGPGPGVLTPLLCAAAKRVTAIELDSAMVTALKVNTATLTNLEIRQGDVLSVDPADLPQPYSVVGNLPYYITSAIIKHFLETEARPERITVTIQKEVAERIVAEPPKMSILAISVQLYGRPRLVQIIPRTAFWPVPKVDSAVLVVDEIGRDLAETLQSLPEASFFKIVRAGFAEKRKQLHNSLSRNLGLSRDASVGLLESAGVEPARRAETLTIPEWVTIGKAYASL